jgi:cystathionine beta-synthase
VRSEDEIGGHMSAPLPMIGSGEPVARAVEALEKADAAVVLDDGKPVGMVTRQDLLAFLANH